MQKADADVVDDHRGVFEGMQMTACLSPTNIRFQQPQGILLWKFIVRSIAIYILV